MDDGSLGNGNGPNYFCTVASFTFIFSFSFFNFFMNLKALLASLSRVYLKFVYFVKIKIFFLKIIVNKGKN